MSITFGVITFPGSNCDHDAYHALAHIMNVETTFLWHKETDLSGIDFLLIPGGFSYGDYLRCGAIARFSPIMQSVVEFAEQGGPVLGICNGFQILLEAGLLPGAMLHNKELRYVCKQVHLRTESTNSIYTRGLEKGQVLQIPVAHGEGNYFIDDEGLKELQDNDQVLFRYSDAAGNVDDETNFNGSVDNIAGICNKQRNVLGMMPHPERAVEKMIGSEDGKLIFESILNEVVTV
ncbi:phosphoribosylformylglycinamidine synthase subunit PurQ [Aliifodinibius sp. S!AR15-10]|uniref:phosphoribosylformylglycinamidine synthase subunit PurQ n=1 Tax=Aliifodinibius sp. S!AR15-10 TaxID=2950437 RepID=UPI0028677E7F|nr:phosphoribosylformylglycinamidine synthase subunit PurQ [Aliifodinibius sp. S!AR15-10]MDR8392985.1 phosphoribosylformylglycinamidine synthase subunit PurQ [Aliifodinibius sp. S!AR15-10]